jgi:hypothetical protein
MTDDTDDNDEIKANEPSDNELKIAALSAAVSSGFLSGATSAANQLTLQLLGRKLTTEEVASHSQLAMRGADMWYVPTFLDSPEGRAIAEILDIELPEPANTETEGTSDSDESTE